MAKSKQADPIVEADPEDEAPEDEAPVEEVAPVPTRALRVTRTNLTTWWCPVCDRSHPHDEATCDACGYVRT